MLPIRIQETNLPMIVDKGYADRAILNTYSQSLIAALLSNFAGRFRIQHYVCEAVYFGQGVTEEFLPGDLTEPVDLEIKIYLVRKISVSCGKKTVLEMVR